MKKFKALASYVTICEVVIEAETEDEAWQIARDMDGGDFEQRDSCDWQIDEVFEVDGE